MPQLGQKKKKPQGGKVRKSKYSPAGPLHGTKPPKVEEPKIAGARLHHEWSKGACYFFNPKELRSAPGAKAEEPKIHPCPHPGSYNIFDFVLCKPDCPCSVPDSVFTGISLPLPNIKDDSSSSDPVLSGRSLALCRIKDDYSSYYSDEGTIPADPYAYRPQWDPSQSYLADPPSVVW